MSRPDSAPTYFNLLLTECGVVVTPGHQDEEYVAASRSPRLSPARKRACESLLPAESERPPAFSRVDNGLQPGRPLLTGPPAGRRASGYPALRSGQGSASLRSTLSAGLFRTGPAAPLLLLASPARAQEHRPACEPARTPSMPPHSAPAESAHLRRRCGSAGLQGLSVPHALDPSPPPPIGRAGSDRCPDTASRSAPRVQSASRS